MIVSLKDGADPAAVLRSLVARGLWVSQVERAPSGAPAHYVIAPCSASASTAEIAAIDGVGAVTTARSPFPLVEKQGPVVEVAGVRVGAGRRAGASATGKSRGTLGAARMGFFTARR